MAKILAIIAPHNFQLIEYGTPKQILEAKGHTVTTASTMLNCIDSRGNAQKADLLLSEVNPTDFDAVYFVGGSGCYAYFEDETALKIAKEFANNNKVSAGICAASSILANAGLLKGKKATCFPSQIENLKAKGANYSGAAVEKDGNIITANGPDAAEQFGEKINQAIMA